MRSSLAAAATIAAAVLAFAAANAAAGSAAVSRGRPAADQCPDRARQPAELAFGCTAIELVRRPEIFVAPLLDTLDERAAMLEREQTFMPAREHVEQARMKFEHATSELRRGALCLAARTADDGAGKMADAVALLGTAIDRRASEVAATRDGSGRGDVTQGEMQIASWHLQQALVAAAGDDAAEAAAAIAAPCSAVAGPLDVRGTVAANDDAAGLVSLEDGTVFGLAANRYETPPAPGTQVEASGVTFGDGSGLATQLKGKTSQAVPVGVVPCAQLRIVPIQPAPAVTLHQPRAYEDTSGELQLEKGMRLAAVDGPCPSTTPEGRVLHYGLTIDVDYPGEEIGRTAQLPVHETIATDLREGDAPVRLPAFVGTKPETITVTVFRTNCTVLGLNLEVCSPPEELSSTEYTAVVRAMGFYATVQYDRREFSVTDEDEAGDFEPAVALGAVPVAIPSSTNPTFSAQGYKVTGNVSSRPQVLPIQEGDTFAVYTQTQDFYDPSYLYTVDEVLATGQERPSGLRWARVTGSRNGAQFWYSARLPTIQHDMVAQCPTLASTVVPKGSAIPGDPTGAVYPPVFGPYTTEQIKNTYYKLPFVDGFTFGTGTNGNIDDPNETRRHPEWQAYALDLGAPEQTLVLAARGGEVSFVQESDPYNTWGLNTGEETPPGAQPAPAGWTGIGNYFFIRHEDGTYAVYFHVPKDTVIPVEGQHVHRGEWVSIVGQSGNASGPHLHFGVATNETHNNAAYVKRVRYEAELQTSSGSVLTQCYIPRSTNTFSSTNELPTPD